MGLLPYITTVPYTEGLLFVTAIPLFQTENTRRRNYLTDFHEIWHGGLSHEYKYLYRSIF